MYLIHWPVPGKHVQCYNVLEELQAEGKIRSLGVSNYTIEDYEVRREDEEKTERRWREDGEKEKAR